MNPFAVSPITAPPTHAQLSFALKLVAEHRELITTRRAYAALSQLGRDTAEENVSRWETLVRTADKRGISRVIDQLKVANADWRKTPAAEAVPAGPEITIGVYRDGAGRVIRVYPARQSSRLLAAEIVHGGTEYLGVASRFVTPDQRLTVKEAAEFGAQFGVCCSCGRLLTDPESVRAGIGPICAGKY